LFDLRFTKLTTSGRFELWHFSHNVFSVAFLRSFCLVSSSSESEDSSSKATGLGARLRGMAGVCRGFFGLFEAFLKSEID
jgi:hypothetical protein